MILSAYGNRRPFDMAGTTKPTLICSIGVPLLVFVSGGIAALVASQPSDSVTITSPLEGAVFPSDIAPPLFRWRGGAPGMHWRVSVNLVGEGSSILAECTSPEWRPSPEHWESIKRHSRTHAARLSVSDLPMVGDEKARTSSATVSFQTSPDPVGAPIFYREVPLPVSLAMDNKPLIAWKVGDVSSTEPPRTVLTGMRTCANCHSFTPDGKTLAMDLDFATDKGAYAIAPIGEDVKIGRSELITWNDYRREDGQETLGFFSTISPNGRYVVSTVKETIVLKFLPDPNCSQIFFPIRGILALYDRETRGFQSLPGGDDPAFVHTNSTFSPDGRTLVFSRAMVPEGLPRGLAVEGGLSPAIVDDFAEGRRKVQYDLYRLPFNNGHGGPAESVVGASANGRSNFFPKYSPDGRWIVFCQADSMMLNRLDSALFIMPAVGGSPRRLKCNVEGRMNSWHSFSPNSRWLVYASKASGPFTQLWLTHIDEKGNDTPPVMLDGFVAAGRAANIPEFVNLAPDQLMAIRIADEIRQSTSTLPTRPK